MGSTKLNLWLLFLAILHSPFSSAQKRLVIGLFFLLFGASRDADSAEIQFVSHIQERPGLTEREEKTIEDRPHLRITGEIVESDLQEIRRLLPKVRALKGQSDILVLVLRRPSSPNRRGPRVH